MSYDWTQGVVEPLIGRAKVESRESWEETSLVSPDFFEQDLRALRLDDAYVDQALSRRESAAKQLAQIDAEIEDFYNTPGPMNFDTDPELRKMLLQRRSILERFRDLISGRRTTVKNVVEQEVQLPLFELSAPGVPGCTATFATTTMQGRALVWNVKIVGSGLGGSASIRVTSTSRFRAAAGERKLVFLPLTVATATVTILAGSHVLGTTRQVMASEALPSNQPGLMLLPNDQGPALGPLIRRFPLAGDTSQAIAEYEQKYESSRTTKLYVGVAALGSEAKLAAEVSIADETILSFELTGGHDYELHGLPAGEGTTWAYA